MLTKKSRFFGRAPPLSLVYMAPLEKLWGRSAKNGFPRPPPP